MLQSEAETHVADALPVSSRTLPHSRAQMEMARAGGLAIPRVHPLWLGVDGGAGAGGLLPIAATIDRHFSIRDADYRKETPGIVGANRWVRLAA